MYKDLNEPFTPDEGYQAINQFKLMVFPDPNAMLTLFYQIFWDIIGGYIIAFILNILNHNGTPNDFN